VDKSFIDHIIDQPDSARLVQTILQLAEDFHLSTVAEGVEDRDQLALLHLWGCHFIQGYYFSRPLPSHAMEELLLQEHPFAAKLEQSADLIGR
jgi:EAL domain-containing protein (putative c-di-GMP-specific phosphodiesterase class I)